VAQFRAAPTDVQPREARVPEGQSTVPDRSARDRRAGPSREIPADSALAAKVAEPSVVPPASPAVAAPPPPPAPVAAPAAEARQEIGAAAAAREPAGIAERARAQATPAAPAPGALRADGFTANAADAARDRWRARDGRVERSLDQGRSWQPATTPAGRRIIAVAPASATVCWAIAADAVLRTSDGTTWTLVPMPSSEALTAIAATDALTATVTTTTGAAWITSDGGATWRRP
jgi:hypothetical protein